MNKICLNCKRSFNKKPKERPSHFLKKKHCCQECYHNNTNHDRNVKNLSGVIHNNLEFLRPSQRDQKSGNIIWSVKCFCGIEFKTRPQRIFSGTTSSCGCYRRKASGDRAKTYIRENHPRWNFDLTKEDRLQKRPFECTDWRKSIFERDGYTCQICKTVGGTLNAHHLDGWNWCVEKRFDLDNGITLCIECHEEFHNIYGRGDNTVQEFLDFTVVLTDGEL